MRQTPTKRAKSVVWSGKNEEIFRLKEEKKLFGREISRENPDYNKRKGCLVGKGD